MDSLKFEKCIRLTESTNDNEALVALRTAQKLCHKNKLDFGEYVLKNRYTQSSTSSRESDYLKARLERVVQEHEELVQQFDELYRENIKLKKKIESNKGSKSLKKKYKDLKEEYEWIEQENELSAKELGIFHHVYDCDKSDKNAVLSELIEEFIKNKDMKISDKNWISTAELYKKFMDETCHDVYVTSVKKFSQILSSQLKIKPIKGGAKKDRMGFPVFIDPFRILWNKDSEDD